MLLRRIWIEAIQGTSRDCLYNELRLESLKSRRWWRKLCAIYKLLSTQCPKYLFDIIPSSVSFYDARKKQRPFFQLQKWPFQIFFSLQILYLYGRNLRQKSKTRGLLQFSRANFSSLYGLAKDLYSMLMTLKVSNTWQDYAFVSAT